MKLSERISRITPHAPYLDDLRALEAALDDANARAQDLTARCDRMRVERGGALDYAADHLAAYAAARMDAVYERDYAVAVLTLVYEMREHALRIHAKNQRNEIARLHAQMRRIFDTGERTLQGQAAVGALREIAVMVGGDSLRLFGCHYTYGPECPSVVELVRVRLQGAIAKIPPGDLWRQPEPIVDAPASGVDMDNLWFGASIPHVALEPTIEGARGLDAADVVAAIEAMQYGEDVETVVEDLARRRVTERAEPTSDEEEAADWACAAHIIKTMNASLATIARRRGARIAALEREALDDARRSDLALAVMRQTSDERDAYKERAERAEGAYGSRLWAVIVERDEAIARAERAEEDARGLRDMCGCELLCGANALGKPYEVRGNSGAISYVQEMFRRVERAETVIARARSMIGHPEDVSYGDASDLALDVLEILDGKEV